MKKSTPTFRSVTWRLTSRPNSPRGAPTGMMAKVRMAGMAAIAGAIEKSRRSAAAGIMSSLVIILITSASGCKSPQGPTRFGPIRSCIQARTRRSASTR